ncbi:carbonic anhydrase [Lonsdalea quercina]|uniref:carbonic anhydrase n=1 Tax=Lonsdalea quercina TaxID=71657 RepID=UPI003976905C
MTTLKPLLAKNRSWALQRRQRHPHYFKQHVSVQKPHSLWIGCSDSRVPAEVLTGSSPGELFVHRNIANMVSHEDDNFMSVLQYALEYLRVSRIVLCGHYCCGGVQAAIELPTMALDQENSALSRRITSLRSTLLPHLTFHQRQDSEETPDEQRNRLVEANVREQFTRLVHAPPVIKAWEDGMELSVFGCVYDLHNGHLKELIHQSNREGAA